MNRKDLYFLLLAPLGKPAHRFSLQAGFSIIEVMMSLVLLAITAALALPSYQEMVQKRQLTHGAEQIMAFVNTAQGEAEAIKAVAAATAQAIQQVALAIQSPGGMDAVNLKVAEKYVEAFGNVAKQGNTLILPGNLADMGTMVATAMSIVKAQK